MSQAMNPPPETAGPAKRIHAKKKWGQHFLTDANIANKIVNCASIQPGDRILEIGPGKGFLTQHLLARKTQVTAIEIDRDLVQTMQCKRFRYEENLTLIQEDALRYDYQRLHAPYKIVANLPYNISTPLLFRLLEEKMRIRQMVLMLQKEVAERITASAGTKSYGALSVILQFFTDVKIAFSVSPHCFHPKPKVASAVISIHPFQKPRIAVRDESLFLKIVKGAFLYRRKQLVNALVCAGYPETTLRSALQRMDCDPARRGETFTLSEFALLSDALHDLGI